MPIKAVNFDAGNFSVIEYDVLTARYDAVNNSFLTKLQDNAFWL